MIIYPAIDLIDGKCVRLSEGDFDRVKQYAADPLDMAMQYEDAGLTHLHLVDLDGARNKKVTQYKVLERLSNHTHLHIDFGGGIQSEDDLRVVFESGAAQGNVGSLAVGKPDVFESWLLKYGIDRLIFAADVRDMMLAAHAWKDISTIHIFELIDRFLISGLHYLTCTDISKDGMLQGVNLELYRALTSRYPDLNIIASGGVHLVDDLHQLESVHCHGVIVGKAIYEHKIKIKDLVPFQIN